MGSVTSLKHPALVLLVTALAFLTISPHSVAEDRPTLKLVGRKYLPPFEYLNEYDVFKGFCVELANALATQTDQDIELYPMSKTLGEICVGRGYLDGFLGMAVTQEGTALYEFTEPYLTVQGRIMVRRETGHIVNAEDLNGCRVAVEKDSLEHHILQKYHGIDLVLLNSQVEAIESLLSNEVDAAIAYDTTALYVAGRWHRGGELKVVGEPLFTAPYAIALAKANSDLAATLNRGLRALRRNGLYDKIHEKWFGFAIDEERPPLGRYLYPVLYVLGAVLLVTLGSLRLNYVLKREVRRRTLELNESNLKLEQQQRVILERDAFKEQILNSVGSGIVTLNRAGRIVTVNDAARRYLCQEGTERAGTGSDFVGRHYTETALYTLIEPAAVDNPGVLTSGVTGADKEVVTRDGRRRYFTVSAYPLVGVDGNVDGVIAVFSDETEKRRLQEQVYRQNKLQALGQMVAGAAHEIRNPLSAIKNFTDLLPKKFGVASFREEFLRHVPAEVARLDRIVADLLSFSARRPPVARTFPVHALVDSALASCRARLKEKGGKLGVSVGEETIHADMDQINQALVNVLMNSIEWIGKGGRIRISSRTENGFTVLSVSDDGKGIAPDMLPDVFNPFFSLRAGGTGLGLTLCHQYVTDNRGTIDIESSPGKGTCIRIRLPATSRHGHGVNKEDEKKDSHT